MKKKKIVSENYLERIPVRSSYLKWTASEDGSVTLEIENTGFFNTVAQKLFGKPKTSYVHLDKTGSFVWPLIDGKKDILSLGEDVRLKFGEDAEPLYERLAKFFQILESYNFITFK
ncbi:MAG: PqqD family protein [Ruminococcaceae bacterium]|nr:PqqD family protein [Oscillospiraceae bacterium]